MNQRQKLKLLKEAGFELLKEGSKHYLYKFQEMIVPISKGSKPDAPNTHRSFLLSIKKAKQRQGLA